jgi:hypothetical protein
MRRKKPIIVEHCDVPLRSFLIIRERILVSQIDAIMGEIKRKEYELAEIQATLVNLADR